MILVHRIIESYNSLGWKGPQCSSSSNPLLCAGSPTSRPGCPEPHPAWPWMPPVLATAPFPGLQCSTAAMSSVLWSFTGQHSPAGAVRCCRYPVPVCLCCRICSGAACREAPSGSSAGAEPGGHPGRWVELKVTAEGVQQGMEKSARAPVFVMSYIKPTADHRGITPVHLLFFSTSSFGQAVCLRARLLFLVSWQMVN